MGEENRGSSGGSTAMMVVAILGGLLVFGCCGGAVVVGLGGALMWQSTPMQMQPPPPMAIQADPQVTKAVDELSKEMVPIQVVPDDLTQPVRSDPDVIPSADLKGPGSEGLPPAPLDEKKE
jgi:hypothetical protein